jgi:acyl-[acyl-carrier-protein]-phospholipid O-acyltransferase/long-chain-fatty-acid--[acyl-carrier-protein] ligase
MLFAVSGFYFANLYMVISAMFLMGLQSTIYSPAKYGLIRDIGGEEGISFGTGTVEMLTFLGVLLGSFLPGCCPM